MNKCISLDAFTRTVVVGAVIFGFVATALADAIPFPHRVTISVFADRYVVGDLAFDDLDYLEKHVTATDVRGVELLICGSKATRAFKAVVHRFRHVPLQVRVPDVDEFQCMSKVPLVRPVRESVGQRPFGINDEAVERYWLDLMP